MIGAFFVFFISLLVGRAVLGLFRLEFSPFLDYFASLTIGLVLLCTFLFFSGYIFPFVPLTIWGVLGGLMVGSVLFLVRLRVPLRFISLIRKIRQIGKIEKISSIFLVILVVWLFGRSLFFGASGQIIAGDRLVWGDWPVHIAITANFAWGQNFPPQHPTFAGIPLTYPFMSDFLSAVLWRMGLNLPLSYVVPGIILSLVFFGLYVGVGKMLLTWNKASPAQTGGVQFETLHAPPPAFLGLIALLLSLFWGGIGFVYWLQEVSTNEAHLVEWLLTPPREYSFWSEKGLWFFTFLYSELLPQRAFLFGLPMFFLCLLLVYLDWQNRKKAYLLLAGLLAGVMPFFHTHSFMALWILVGSVGIVWIVARVFSQLHSKLFRFRFLSRVLATAFPLRLPPAKAFTIYLWFIVPFTLLTLIQLPLFRSSSHLLKFNFGWVKGSENFFIFWFKNTGLFIPLWWLGFWKGNLSGKVKLLGLASWSLFIIPNLIQFAAWGYDNLKLFTYWYLLGAFFVAVGLWWIWQRGFIGRLLSIILFVTLTLTGIVEVGRLIDTQHRQIGLWSREEQQIATKIRDLSAPDSIFLTAAIHDHPIATLAGRKTILGFPGNAWSWGIDGWYEREQDAHAMYKGGEVARSLWKKYAIDYIMVSDRERYFEKNINERFIGQNSELVLEEGTAKVYKVN